MHGRVRKYLRICLIRFMSPVIKIRQDDVTRWIRYSVSRYFEHTFPNHPHMFDSLDRRHNGLVVNAFVINLHTSFLFYNDNVLRRTRGIF